nr:restriction endonuclease subunit S [Clostridioides difficile]
MNVPKIRFKEFDEEWKACELREVASVLMNKRVFKTQTSNEGDVPFYKIGTFGGVPDAFISRELFDEYKAKYSYPQVGDTLLSASGSIGKTVEYRGEDEYFQDSNIVWLQHKSDIEKIFLKCFYEVVKWEGLEGSTIKRLYNKNILDTKIKYPINEEQIKIGEYFKTLDNLINNHQNKYDKLIKIKKSMLEKMFPQKCKNIPEIRFKGFTEPWEKYKLDEISSIITKQTGFDYSDTIKPSLITMKEEGMYSFIQNKDFNGENINLNTDFYIPISVAKNFPKITIDTPSILISISGKIGNVGYYRLEEKAFIGGAVGICKLLKDNGSLIVYYLQSDAGQAYFNSLIKASSHANITVEDIRKIEVLLPKSFYEEEKISKYFNNLDNLINQNAQQLERLKNIKKALLEKMFV